MAFDLDDEELRATRKLNGLDKERSDKNVANIEDIEILKKDLFYYDEIHENLDDDTVNFYEALRHILVEREQDKKRIQELEEDNKKHIERFEKLDDELWERIKQCKNMQTEIDRFYLDKEELQQAYLHERLAKEEVEELLENSIPKQKVKDKIEELKEGLKKTTEGKLQMYTPSEFIYQIQVLEELLEGEKEV